MKNEKWKVESGKWKMKTLPLISTCLVIVGAILKILHLVDPWSSIVFYSGIALFFLYLFLRLTTSVKVSNKS